MLAIMKDDDTCRIPVLLPKQRRVPAPVSMDLMDAAQMRKHAAGSARERIIMAAQALAVWSATHLRRLGRISEAEQYEERAATLHEYLNV